MNERRPVSRPVPEVVDAVAATADERERVREALDPIRDGDHVTREAVESAVSDTAKLVATAETRTELAGMAHDDAVESAAGVEDIPIVADRLDRYADRLADVERRAASLAVPTPDETLSPDAVHELALDLREVAASAQGVARTADDLSWDLEQFASWLEAPDRRHEEFREDVALVEESVADLRTAVEALDRPSAPAEPTGGDDPEAAVAWADATVRARVLDLLVTDLRAELADLRTLAERREGSVPEALARRVAALDREVAVLTTRLTDRAEAAWRERFADELTAVRDGLAGLAPPVDWGRVETVASEQRAAIGAE